MATTNGNKNLFSVGDLRKVASCIASHQLLQPDHEVMSNNRVYFIDQNLIQKEWFEPRSEAVKYNKRHKYEVKFGKYIETAFTLEKKELKVDKEKKE